jgi:hypothetical protein
MSMAFHAARPGSVFVIATVVALIQAAPAARADDVAALRGWSTPRTGLPASSSAARLGRLLILWHADLRL